ncbi:MAG: phytanoyl-CoA dioxygenase family protein [Gammaproteobacteria bacterium]|nr:phytanoyl-CoA dioxygenase family protein [Gammaproteobacteria bacterium]
MLTEQQVASYGENGYLVLEQLIDRAQLAVLRDSALAIIDGFDVGRHHSVFSARAGAEMRDDYFFESAERVSCFLEQDALDGDGNLTQVKHECLNKIGHALHDLTPPFTRFCRLPIFAELLTELGCRAPELWQTMYILKPPRVGGEVRWHQDASYLITEPAAVIGIWVAIDDATRDNGCLWVQPGGQRTPLREVFERTPAGRCHLRQLDAMPWPSPNAAVALEVAAGSVVVFHDHLPHYSSHNYSARPRHAFSMHAKAGAAEWSARNWLQRRSFKPFRL